MVECVLNMEEALNSVASPKRKEKERKNGRAILEVPDRPSIPVKEHNREKWVRQDCSS